MPSLPIVTPDDPLSQALGDASETEGKRGSYAVVSLGCPKNLVDTEQMLGRLDQEGYRMVADADGADFVVINTCGFIQSARDESLGAIDEMLGLKRSGKVRGVVVTGCLAERQREQLLEARPEIDALVGVFGRDEITEVANRFAGTSSQEEQRTVFRPAPVRALPDNIRSAVTPQHFAYMKISEGCDRLCTFCAIPKMRGKHASKPIEQIVEETKRLADSGVREVNIVAQDTTYYGLDLYGKPRLTDLLVELDKVESLDWIRLMYFYPMYIDDSLMDTIAGAERILPYIDMPLQHASDFMLRRMSRRVRRAETEDLLHRLRERIPGLVMRTTMITGFPGETDDDFRQLVEFVETHRFEHLGVFTYSTEPDTPAAKLPNPVPQDVMEARRDELMAVQQAIAFDWNDKRVGTVEKVLLDSPLPDQPGVFLGRSWSDAPDIDGLVYVSQQPGQDLQPGQFVECEIVASQGYDLVAVALDSAS